jgi:hypothetical protein
MVTATIILARGSQEPLSAAEYCPAIKMKGDGILARPLSELLDPQPTSPFCPFCLLLPFLET